MCNREAPEVEQFARQNAKTLTVVGLGAHDTLPLAKTFVGRNKMTSALMLWDKGGKTWSFYGVPGQPATLLIRDGKVTQSWLGPIDVKAVYAAATA